MKKTTLIVAGLVAIAVALGLAGFALAQKPTPTFPYDETFGPGMMYGRRGPGMMGEGGYGPMHEYMEDALAEALDLSHEEFEERLAAGETPWSIAEEKGLTSEEFADLMLEARNKALDAAVADGVLSQEQADWMKEHMNTMWQNGFGPGTGGCMGPGYGARRSGPGWRWSQP